ncbi:uncharacterized protein LOC135369060 [Ornithodoros turicata]|uniref:uncharacterized protein LOC135369060 n=1 Tax=Ornithodoros turicata TaxID=34597 RepID=UPI003138924A
MIREDVRQSSNESVRVSDPSASLPSQGSADRSTTVTFIGHDSSSSCVQAMEDAIGPSQDESPRSPSNELTQSEKLIVQLFLEEAEKKQRVAAGDLIEPDEESERIRSVSEGLWTRSSSSAAPPPPRLHLSDLLVPSTFVCFLVGAVLVLDVMLITRYYEGRTGLFFAMMGFLHAPCVPFFVFRMYFLVVRSTVTTTFIKVVVGVWYVVTFPFLHLLPMLMLASAAFDKALMILGDPSDTRTFVNHQEEIAFGDLVWVAVVHCFPQGVLQLYLLLFQTGLHRVGRDYTALLQLLCTACCIVLIASIAAFYTKYVPLHHDEDTDCSTTCDTTFDGYHDPASASFLKLLSWIFLITARVLAGATIVFSFPSVYVVGLLFLHVPFVIIWSSLSQTTYTLKNCLRDLSFGVITMIIVLNYQNSRREGLATLMASVLFVIAIFLEDTVCLVVTYFTTNIEQSVALVLVCTHYALMAVGLLLFMGHLKAKSARKTAIRL